MSGERATCCAHLRPRQALWKEEVCASVFGQLPVGAVYLLHAGLPFGKQPWGSSAWQPVAWSGPFLSWGVIACCCQMTSSSFSKQSTRRTEGLTLAAPCSATFFPSAAAQDSHPPSLVLQPGSAFLRYAFNPTTLEVGRRTLQIYSTLPYNKS